MTTAAPDLDEHRTGAAQLARERGAPGLDPGILVSAAG